MKMVKSLLLGTAAGLVAIASAQAADLPVKAKPVQYVKICSLYGAGFYYIPGTDICLKVGGWTRAEYAYNVNSSITTGPFANNRNDRIDQNDYVIRTRGYITADARNQTAYGTLRSYIAVGVNYDSPAASSAGFNSNRAFIQWAGFTFGTAVSFFDFYSAPATQYFGFVAGSDTGDPGWKVAAYTAQFGNGFSATISAEEPRRIATVNSNLALALPTNAADTIGIRYPDIVANLRVDQAWGSAQIMGAIHDASGGYYGAATAATLGTAAGVIGANHPGDKTGWAVGAGIKLNAPMISPGDYFQAQIGYAEGAARYTFQANNFSQVFYSGNNVGIGVLSDGVYGGTTAANASNVELTRTLSINAAYEHFWNQQWKTSLWYAYGEARYSTLANALLCGSFGATQGTNTGVTSAAAAGCNQNWSVQAFGTRTQWNVTKDFYMGLEVVYQNLRSATFAGGAVNLPANGAQGAGTTGVGDQNAWSARFRVHRDFMP